MKRPMSDLAIVVASCLNCAGACLLVILWRLDIFYYLPIAFIISCMIGIITVDIERSVVYTIFCVVIGNAIAATILLSPYAIFEESIGRINTGIILILGSIGKLFLISVGIYFVGVISGCFLGEKTTSWTEA